MSKPWEFIEHTADIFVKAYGATVADAFATVAEAMFALIVDESPIEPAIERQFTIDALDRESLLVQFLSQLIVLHEVDKLVFSRFDISIENDTHVHCACWGELFDEHKHQRGLMIKAVSYHLLEITDPADGELASVKVLFDI